MKQGWGAAIRRYCAQGMARLHVEALRLTREDIRRTYAELDAGTKVNVTVVAEDAARITGVATAIATHTAGTDDLTDLDDTAPYHMVAYALDESAIIGSRVVLSKISAFLDIQRNTGAAPYDGKFGVSVYRLGKWGRSVANAADVWYLTKVADSLKVEASTIGSTPSLVDFTFATSTYDDKPPGVVIDGSFAARDAKNSSKLVGTPQDNDLAQQDPLLALTGRVVIVVIRAYGGTNTNYSWKYESAGANPKTIASAGTLYFRQGSIATGHPGLMALKSEAGTGMPRISFYLAVYSATGTLSFTGGSQVDLGAVPTGTVEFRVKADVPPGTTGTAYARVAAIDAWVVVKDGQTHTDVGLALSRTYEMKYEFAADSSQYTTPVLYELGAIERAELLDLTEFCTAGEPSESVDPQTGEVKMAEVEFRLGLTGNKDYRDDVTRLLYENDWDDIEIRTHAYHPDLARSEWGYLDLWRLDDAVINGPQAVLTCVSVLEQLKGKFPRPSGSEVGYLLKTTASDLTGLGGDYQKEISPSTQGASTFVWTVAGSATEFIYLVTPANLPQLRRWGTGPWTVNLSINSGNANIKLACRIKRVNAAGALQEIEPTIGYSTGEEITASTGQKTFTFNELVFGEGALTDRLVVEIRARNTDAGAQAFTIDTGTTATEVRPPWIPTSTITPQSFSDVYPKDAYGTWRDSVCALPERYRGAKPDRAAWKVFKFVMGADGKREAERILFLDGCCQIASQGVIKAVNLFGPRGLAVASFPMETYTPFDVGMGFRSRLPEFKAGYGYETRIPNAFAGTVTVRHAAAYTAFGLSKIDEPVNELDSEIARYIRDQALAAELCRNLVLAYGCGDIRIGVSPTESMPWLEIGDEASAETDRLAFKDPLTGVGVRGPLWAMGTIIGKSGPMLRPRFLVKPRGLVDLFVTTDSTQNRTPFEGPVAIPTIERDQTNPGNALLRVRGYPDTATLYYYYHATTVSPPERTRKDLWSTWTSAVTLARDSSADKLLSVFAEYQDVRGAIITARVAPDGRASITTLTAVEATTNVSWAASGLAANAKSIRWYLRRAATVLYPTTDNTATGPLDETYFVAEKAVHAERGGGLSVSHGSFVAGDDSQVIAIPIDNEGNAGPRKTATYAWAGSSTRAPTAPVWVVNTVGSASVQRTWDVSWGAGSMLATDDFRFVLRVDGVEYRVAEETTDPTTTLTKTNVSAEDLDGPGQFFPRSGDPDHEFVFLWELRNSVGTLINSGTFAPAYGENVEGTILA